MCTDWCGNNLSFIQIRCGGLLEGTYFWQLIVPGKDKRKDEKRAFCRSSRHFGTKPLLFLILRKKRGLGSSDFLKVKEEKSLLTLCVTDFSDNS